MKALLTTFTALGIIFGSVSIANAAEENESETGLALPRMVSLRSSLINVRTGPGQIAVTNIFLLFNSLFNALL